MSRLTYRLWQGFSALTAWAVAPDDALAAQILGPGLYPLFARMHRSDRLHALRVIGRLRAAGHDHPALLTAALLHDLGKDRHRTSLIGRTAVVLARHFAPALYRRWAASNRLDWRKPFVVAAMHPEWSAQAMAAAGAPELAVRLARRHAEPRISAPQTEEDRLLAALQAADDAS